MDSAFDKCKRDYLIKSSNITINDNRLEARRKNQATSMRQSSEWGMRGFQASFPRLKDPFYYETSVERCLIMKLCILLYNVQTQKVGINQIRNTYMKHLNSNANMIINDIRLN